MLLFLQFSNGINKFELDHASTKQYMSLKQNENQNKILDIADYVYLQDPLHLTHLI